MKKPEIFPVLLAAGSSKGLGFPKPLARFGEQTALEIAVANCVGLATPVVVLGSDAAVVRCGVPRGACVVINRRWRSGQLSSLQAGLRKVPRDAAFLIYPVDLPLLTRSIVFRLVRVFEQRPKGKTIVMPVFRSHPGHPVICAAEIRHEMKRGRTAREVVYQDRERVCYVLVRASAVCQDFANPTSYLDCLKRFRAQKAFRESV